MPDAAELRQQLAKLPKQKAFGPDKFHEFLIKEFMDIHKKIITHLNKCLENGTPSKWMMKEITWLILTDEKKGNETTNAFLSCGMFSQEHRQCRFFNIWKEINYCRINRRAAEDRVGEPKIS